MRHLTIEEWGEQREHERRHPGKVCGQCPIERLRRESLPVEFRDSGLLIIVLLCAAMMVACVVYVVT